MVKYLDPELFSIEAVERLTINEIKEFLIKRGVTFCGCRLKRDYSTILSEYMQPYSKIPIHSNIINILKKYVGYNINLNPYTQGCTRFMIVNDIFKCYEMLFSYKFLDPHINRKSKISPSLISTSLSILNRRRELPDFLTPKSQHSSTLNHKKEFNDPPPYTTPLSKEENLVIHTPLSPKLSIGESCPKKKDLTSKIILQSLKDNKDWDNFNELQLKIIDSVYNFKNKEEYILSIGDRTDKIDTFIINNFIDLESTVINLGMIVPTDVESIDYINSSLNSVSKIIKSIGVKFEDIFFDIKDIKTYDSYTDFQLYNSMGIYTRHNSRQHLNQIAYDYFHSNMIENNYSSLSIKNDETFGHFVYHNKNLTTSVENIDVGLKINYNSKKYYIFDEKHYLFGGDIEILEIKVLVLSFINKFTKPQDKLTGDMKDFIFKIDSILNIKI